MELNIHTREAANKDIPALARLIGELGYPVSKEQMEKRLKSIVHIMITNFGLSGKEYRVCEESFFCLKSNPE